MASDTGPETSDLAFAVVPFDALDRIRREGLGVGRLVPRLEPAEERADEDSAILVAQRPSSGHEVGASAILNLSPYIPPVAVAAGGGIVVNEEGSQRDVLLILRRGFWDLPKGKPEPGEPIAACALREVREEVGLRSLELLAPAGTTVHAYREGGRLLVKRTHWFWMRTAETAFVPQAEEQIERVEWVPWAEAAERVGYENLRRHLRALDINL